MPCVAAALGASDLVAWRSKAACLGWVAPLCMGAPLFGLAVPGRHTLLALLASPACSRGHGAGSSGAAARPREHQTIPWLMGGKPLPYSKAPGYARSSRGCTAMPIETSLSLQRVAPVCVRV